MAEIQGGSRKGLTETGRRVLCCLFVLITANNTTSFTSCLPLSHTVSSRREPSIGGGSKPTFSPKEFISRGRSSWLESKCNAFWVLPHITGIRKIVSVSRIPQIKQSGQRLKRQEGTEQGRVWEKMLDTALEAQVPGGGPSRRYGGTGMSKELHPIWDLSQAVTGGSSHLRKSVTSQPIKGQMALGVA